jgi:glycosyltransferase involved in cell wall biosynthesis
LNDLAVVEHQRISGVEMSAERSRDTVTATIVVTTHNRQELADRALASALAQADIDVEVIVVDDGSEPPYRATTDDARVRVIRNELPHGPSAARNQALKLASGTWITFLDDDDVLLPTMLLSSIEAADRSSLARPVSTLSGAQIVDTEGNVLETRLPPTLPLGAHFFLEDVDGSFQTHATLVAPTKLLREMHGFDEELPASEHDDFFLRLNALSSIEGLQAVTYQITAHSGPRLSKSVLERAEGMESTVAKHKKTFEQHRRRYAHYQATIGVTYLRAGKWWPAVKASTKALIIDPTRPKAYYWWLASLAGPLPIEIRRRFRPGRGGS